MSDNFLEYLPDEIGRLTSLKVLNLSRNKLQCLPYSLAKITQLQSLWLSENQQKPIMKLQPDTDQAGHKILTCFLLPQQPLDDVYNQASANDEDGVEKTKEETASPCEERHAIKFAKENGENLSDEEEMKDKVLLRNPTPYPKELKAHARHARNLALKQSDSKPDVIEDIDTEQGDIEMIMPGNAPGASSGESNVHYQIRNAVLKEALVGAVELAHIPLVPCTSSDHSNAPIQDTQAFAYAESTDRMCNSENRFSTNGNGNEGFHIKRSFVGNTKPFYHETTFIEQRESLQQTEVRQSYHNTHEHIAHYMNDNSVMSNDMDSPSAVNESMFVNVNDSLLSNNYYTTETSLYKATAAIVQNDTLDDSRIAQADSFSSITSVYPSSESDRARSSKRSSFSSPINLINERTDYKSGHLYHPSQTSNMKPNGQHNNQKVFARPDSYNSPSKVTVHEFANEVHLFKPPFVTRNAQDHIISKQIGSSCEKIRETTSDSSSQSSAASFMNQTNYPFRAQNTTHTFPVIIVKNPDLGFVIEGGVDQMHSSDAVSFLEKCA